MANKGPLYGLSKDCKIKASKKFDIKQVREVLQWMGAVLGRDIHPDLESLWSERDAAAVLRDGVALCELMNTINPGSIKKINRQGAAFKQMENLELFTKACIEYGLKQIDVFQIADLFENKAVYTVYNCLHALGSLARKNGFEGPNYGVRISEKKERHFSTEQIVKGKMIIPMQAGTNVVPSQAGMSPYGFSRQIVPSDSEQTVVSPISSNIISLQYGNNSMGSQKGMTPYGLGRQITLSTSDEPVFETNTNSKLERSEHVDNAQALLEREVNGEHNENEILTQNNNEECNVEGEMCEDNENEESTKVVDDETNENSERINENERDNSNGVDGSSVDGSDCNENGECDAEIDNTSNECFKKEVNGDGDDCDVLQVNGS